MAKKPNITTIASGYYSRAALNNNFEGLRDAFDNTLSLDGSTPNAMGADLDLNNNNLLNVDRINGVPLTGGFSDLSSAIAASEAARDKAQEWATNPEDTPVETGQFSALHWSAKAEDEKLAAQAARTGAETAKTNAETAQAAAEAAQFGAETAETNAETARDAAFVNADVYADTTAGLAATTVGDQFQVVEGDEVIRYQHDAGPVATEVARYPAATFVRGLRDDLDEVRSPLALYVGSDDTVPLFTDNAGRVLLGVSKTTGDLVGANIGDGGVERVLGEAGGARYTGSGPVWPVLTDAGGRVLLGYNETTGAVVGAITAGGGDTGSFPTEALADPIVPTAYNHLLFYGQSLSVGAAAGAVLSTTQPYSNVTFNGGPRAWNGTTWDFGAFKPLIEDEVSPAPDGGTNRKETPCSGAANYASTLLALDGTAPADHVILASTAGHGGYRIDQLDKASAWYSNLTAHVTGAQTLNTDHAVHALCWMQGENDIVSATPYATYRADLNQLQADFEVDAKAITGQTHPVYLLTYQVSYGATTHEDVALAQLDLAQKSDRFFLTTPTYHLPHSDGVHLTAVGYKWAGAYFGRAYSEIVQGRKPRWLNPVSATRRGAEVRVRMQVPTLPLVLDTITLAATADHGFRVTDGGVTATISSITVDGSEVVISLASAPTGAVVVRYALDSLGTGLSITNGASGNLRDSTPDTITLGGVAYPLYHVAPAFQITAITLGE